VIRQTISCDMCKSEKKHSNHWFVAFEQGAELRLAGWNSRYRTRPGAKHLCGQACVYRLMDDFMARLVAMKPPAEDEKAAPARVRAAAAIDTSLTSNAAYGAAYGATDSEIESSARLVKPAAELVTMPAKTEDARTEDARRGPVDEAPHYGSRNWRAEVWEREMEREREIEEKPNLLVRHGL